MGTDDTDGVGRRNGAAFHRVSDAANGQLCGVITTSNPNMKSV